MMLSLERAIRVYRALVESPVKVDSATVVSWPHLERALSHDSRLLTEMRTLSATERARVQAYAGEFAPLADSRPVYQFPTAREAGRFIQEVVDAGGNASHLDGGGLVAASGYDHLYVENLAATLGGVLHRGPALSDHFDYVDRQLPEALFIESGLDSNLCESVLLASLRGAGVGKPIQESMLAGIFSEGQLAPYKTRIDTFARLKMVLGVSKPLAEAVRLAGFATPRMLAIMEAGDPNGVAAGGGAEGGGPSDRGGIAKDQPDGRNGQPANSRSSEQQPQQPPTEHVPSQEQGGATNAIKLPDGTEVPFDVMKQAFAKMLHNMATQVENGTMGGQPEPRGVDQADATGGNTPQPSVAQQQVAAQSGAQQAAGNGAEPAVQPAQADGEPAAPAAPAAPTEPDASAPAAPAAPPAPGQAPAPGDPAVDAMLDKAEQGDQEALKQAQGMQGQMTPEQKQRLQALAAGQQAQGGGAAPPPQAEGYLRETKYSKQAQDAISAEMHKQRDKSGTHSQKVGRAIGVAKSNGLKVPPRPASESVVQENLRDALRLLVSSRERDLIAGIGMVREGGMHNQPSKLVERVLDQLNLLAAHQSKPVREAAVAALGSLYEDVTESYVSTALGHVAAGAAGKRTYAGTSQGHDKKGGEGIFASVKSMFKGGKKESMDMKAWHAKQQASRESMTAARKAYQKQKTTESCTIWALTDVVPAATLPEGLEYQGGGCAPGDHVALVEEGQDTSLVRTLSGDTVRVANHHLNLESFGGFVDGELVETAGLVTIIESMRGGDLVLVVGAPHSGKGHFINTVVGPCVAEGRALPHTLTVQAPWNDIQERTAREDFSTLLREGAHDQVAFDQALMSPRFRYVSEGSHALLRDNITWDQFRRCGSVVERLGVGAGLSRFLSNPNVQRYYEDMRGDVRAATARVFRDRVSEAVIVIGDSLVVDCSPSTNLSEFASCAAQAGMNIHLVEFITPLKLSLARSNLKESVVRRAANAVAGAVDEVMRAGAVGRHTRYIWDGDESVGVFTAVEGKFADNQIVTQKKKDIDGDNPDEPKVRKDIVVRESFGTPWFTPAQRAQNVVDFRRDFPQHAHLTEADFGDGQWFVGEVVKPGRIMGQTRWFTVRAADQREAKFKIESEFSRQERLPLNFPIKFKSIRPISDPHQGRGFIIESLNEQLDTGQASESESCASGIQAAGKLLSDARAAIFELTTSSLVQCASMAQATGMKKTKGLLDKVQQQGATFLDDLKMMGDLLDKANEAMKGENGGMGGDNVDAVKQQAAAMANGPAPTPDASAPAPVPGAAPPAAAPSGAPAPVEPAVGEAISSVLGTPFMETLKSGADYRELNESLMSYCPTLDVRQRTQVIDRLKAMSLLPEDAKLRVNFGSADHRLLSESAQFGSISSGLVERTRGGRTTFASATELQAAIKSLRARNGSMHLNLAETLERGLVQAQLSEDRAKAAAWGDSFSEHGPFKLNVAKIGVKDAIRYAESTYERFGMNVYDDLPDLERNFMLLKGKMKFAYNIPRIEMPVMEPKKGDIAQFTKDVAAGAVDIFEPWSEEQVRNLFPWERSGHPKLSLGDKSWIGLGFKDGDPNDDKLNIGSARSVSVSSLKPIQAEIWFDKLIATIITHGPPAPGSFVTSEGVAIVSSDHYILDGHHRFGQIYLADPKLPMQALVVDIPHMKLLDITRSYGTARGNRAKD